MKKLHFLLLLICIGILCLSLYKIVSYFSVSEKEQADFKKLSSITQNFTINNTIPENTTLPQYTALYEQNNELFGWIKINGTPIDYPIMHSPENPDFYLDHSFSKNKSQSGVPYISNSNFKECGNYIVYGHNMKNGSMFASILKYKDKSYWQEHKTITFNTLNEEAEYEVIGAFRSKNFKVGEAGFKYYQYTNLTDETRFNEYISNAESLFHYDTEIKAQYGNQLLTLSTCAYHTQDGRFVVVAKK